VTSVEEAFTTVAPILGRWLRRMPDGEPGVRARWIRWQAMVLERHPAFQPRTGGDGGPAGAYELDPDNEEGDLTFSVLGYADAAAASYEVFARFKRKSIIDPACRFQVSLPTPFAVITSQVAPRSREMALPAYEAAMLNEVQELRRSIPPEELAIQWDVAVEIFRFLDDDPPRGAARQAILDRLVGLGDSVPEPVEVGYHLCFGDARRHNYREPADAGLFVDVFNQVAPRVGRPVTWVHMGVPRRWTERAHFAPLRQLQLGPTELYLGLVHPRDGLSGARRRIDLASGLAPRFGVGAPCGLGRQIPGPGDRLETLKSWLRLHAEVALPLD
jgi:hypothetical protein